MQLKVDKKLSVFSTIVKDHQSLNQKLIEVIDEDQVKDPRRVKSNVKAWHTSWITHLKNPGYDDLIAVTLKYLRKIEQEYMNVKDPFTYRIHNLWAMKYVPGEYAEKHNHYPSDWSAVYYVDVEKDSSAIKFENNLTINPQRGMLLLFPSIMDHEVPPTTAKRTAVSMNIIKDLTNTVT